ESADAYIAHEMQPQGFLHLLFELIEQRLIRACELRLIAQVPVLAHLGLASGLHHHQVSGWKLANAAKHRERGCDEAQREVLVECLEIHRAKSGIECEEPLDLRCKREPARRVRIVERLLSEVVASREEPPL